MVCKWQVEIDPFCQKVLTKHWPDVPKYGDIKDVGKHNLEAVDVICGGFPCQPHSVAGKQRGAADDRNLWPEYLRIIKELKPHWVVGENVPGIIATYLDTVLSDLEGEGYEIATFNLPACGFDAPHRRERIFVVAYPNSRKLAVRRQYRTIEGNGRRRKNNGTRSRGDCGRVITPQSDEVVAHTNSQRLEKWKGQQQNNEQGRPSVVGRSWWSTQPRVGRVVNGVPGRVDRIRALGNAVVPQVAQFIGEALVVAAQTIHQP